VMLFRVLNQSPAHIKNYFVFCPIGFIRQYVKFVFFQDVTNLLTSFLLLNG